MNEINERLAVVLKEFANGNKKKFAQEIGTTDTSVGKWVTSDRSPDINVVARICKLYGISAEWMLHGEGGMMKSGEVTNIINVSKSSGNSSSTINAGNTTANETSNNSDIISFLKEQLTEQIALNRTLQENIIEISKMLTNKP